MAKLLVADATAPYGYAVMGVLVVLVLVLSLVDLFTKDGLGAFGVLLNFTYTRMLYVYVTGYRRGDPKAAGRATSDFRCRISANCSSSRKRMIDPALRLIPWRARILVR